MTDTAKIEALVGPLERLEGLMRDMNELNPSNYDHDDACRLNNEAGEIANIGIAYLSLTTAALRALSAENERMRTGLDAIAIGEGLPDVIARQALEEQSNG